MHIRSNTLADYYTTKTCLVDSSDKKERDSIGLVKRAIVYNKDLKATNEHICNVRGYENGMKDTYLKFGGDDGGGFLKINSTIESLVESPPNNTTDNPKWSYQSGLTTGELKDSGVRRVTILGRI